MTLKRSRCAGLAAFLALAVVAGLAAGASHATARGRNGRIAFRRYFNKDHSWGAIFTINPNGTGERQITHPPKGMLDDNPDWAPDGSLISFQRCGANLCAVYTIRPDGLRQVRVSSVCHGKPAKCESDYSAGFSPNGKSLVFVDAHGAQTAIVMSDTRGRHRRTILPNRNDIELNDPQLSPDGKRLVYVLRDFTPKDRTAVFVANIDGSGAHLVSPWSLVAGDGPDWSPNGRWILFRSDWPRVKQSQIFVVHPDATALTRLTLVKRGTTVTSSSFSPDGKWITYGANGLGGQPDVWVMHADGGHMRPVTRTRSWDSAPDWGPAR
jgi:TolB protein